MFFNLIIKANQSEGVSFAKETSVSYGMFGSDIDTADYPEMDAREAIVKLSYKIFEKLKKSSKLDPEIKLKLIHSSQNIAQTSPDQKLVYLSSGYFLNIDRLSKTRPELASEDEIAATLAHELAHNLFKHDEFNETPFIEEYAADQHGLEIMDKAGFNVKASLNFFDRLAAKESRKFEGGDLSFERISHPSSFRRKVALENLIGKKVWQHSEKEIKPMYFKSFISEKYHSHSQIEKTHAAIQYIKKESHPAEPFRFISSIRSLIQNAETQPEIFLILNHFHQMIFNNAWLKGTSFSVNEDLWLLVKEQQKTVIENEEKTKQIFLNFVANYLIDEKERGQLTKLNFFKEYQKTHQSIVNLAEKKLLQLGKTPLESTVQLLENVYLSQNSMKVLIKYSDQFNKLKMQLGQSHSRAELMSILGTFSNERLLFEVEAYDLIKSFIDKEFWSNLSELISDLKILIKKINLDDKVFFEGDVILIKNSEEIIYEIDKKNIKFSLPFQFLLNLWNTSQYDLFYKNLFENFNESGMWARTKAEGRQVYFTPFHHLVYMFDLKNFDSKGLKHKKEFVQWARAAFMTHFVETKSDSVSRNISELLLSIVEYTGDNAYPFMEAKSEADDFDFDMELSRADLQMSDLNIYFARFLRNMGIGFKYPLVVKNPPSQFDYPKSLIEKSKYLEQKYFDYQKIEKIQLKDFDSFVGAMNEMQKRFNDFNYKHVLQSQISSWLDEKMKNLKKTFIGDADNLDHHLYTLRLFLDYEQYDDFKNEFALVSKKLEKNLSASKIDVNESDFENKSSEDYLSDVQKIIIKFLDRGYELAVKEKKFESINLLEELQLLAKIYPVEWTVRDSRFLKHFEGRQLHFDEKRLLLSYLISPYLRIQEGEKLFLEIENIVSLSFENHLDLIIKIFPDYSLNRDEKLNNLLMEKGFHFDQAQMSENYFTEFGFMNQSDTIHFQNMGIESMRDLMAMFDAQTRVEVFLWMLDLGPEPWLLRDLRLSAKIPAATFKNGINGATFAEKELFLKEFLIGPVGLLTSRRVSNIEAAEKFYDRLFEVAIPRDLPLKSRQQLKLIFSFLMQSMAPQKKVNCLLSMIEARKNAYDFSQLAVRFLEEMGILGIKLAQYLVSRTKVLSPQMELEFLKLTDRAKPIDKINIFRFLEKELKDSFSKIAEVQNVLGTASIKQVQVLKLDDGSLIAAKIQRPGLREGLGGDFELIDRLFQLIKNNRYLFNEFNLPDSFAQEIKNTLVKEIEFTEETANQTMIAKNVQKRAKKADGIKIIVPELSTALPVTRAFIAEEYVLGSKRWTDLNQIEKMKYAKAVVTEIFQQIFEDKHFHADPHPGNMLFKDNQIFLIDYGQVGKLSIDNEKWLFSLLDSFVSDNMKQLESQILILHQQTPEEKKKNISVSLVKEKLSEYFSKSKNTEGSLLERVQNFTLLLNELGIYLPETFYLLMKTLNSLNYLIETDQKNVNQFIYDFMKTKYQKFKLNPLEKKYQMSESDKQKYYAEVIKKDFGTASIDLSDIDTLPENTRFRKKGDAQTYCLLRTLNLSKAGQVAYFTLQIKNEGEEHLSGQDAGVHFLRDAKNYEVFVKNEWVNLQDLVLTAQSQRVIRSENADEKWRTDYIKGGTKVKLSDAQKKLALKLMGLDIKHIYKMDTTKYMIYPTLPLKEDQEIRINLAGFLNDIKNGNLTEKDVVAMSIVLGTVKELEDLELEIEGRWVKLKDLRLR